MGRIYKQKTLRQYFKVYQETDFGIPPTKIAKKLKISKQLENIIAKSAIRRLWQDKELRARYLRLRNLEEIYGKI